jgi:hypothetical protein
LVKDERGGQGHTSKTILHRSATWRVFYMSASLTLCFVLSAIDGKIKQRVSKVLREAW